MAAEVEQLTTGLRGELPERKEMERRARAIKDRVDKMNVAQIRALEAIAGCVHGPVDSEQFKAIEDLRSGLEKSGCGRPRPDRQWLDESGRGRSTAR